MKKLTIHVNTPADAEKFILDCESDFHKQIDFALDKVLRENVRIIALAGPTCSGKTTTAERLIERITADGKKAVVMSIDDFFMDRGVKNRVDLEAPDYDSVNAIDLKYLENFLSDLLDGKKVYIPRYSFTETRRVGYEEYIPEERDIYVFEGIQAVYPEITRLFHGGYRSIFICVDDDIEYDGVFLHHHEIRLLRRIVRDYKFRGATAEFSLHLWEGVRANEEKNIFPNAKSLDVYINSFLPYEPFIIAHHVIPLLETVPASSPYRDEAEALLQKIKVFDNPYFSDTMIPAHSVYREFIG